MHSWFCPKTLAMPLFFVIECTEETWEWLGYYMTGANAGEDEAGGNHQFEATQGYTFWARGLS